jgi:dipeptidase E
VVSQTLRKLVLYSDQIRGQSDALDDALMTLLAGTSHRVAFIPSESDRRRRYFVEAERHYAALGIRGIHHCDVDLEWDPAAMATAFSCDAIHLGSGDPAAFLGALRRRALLSPLRDFVARGGVLVGVSAGAMLMAKSIALAQAVSDEPRERAQKRAKSPPRADFGALGLVDFDFYPHFEPDSDGAADVEKALRDFSRTSGRVLYACTDSEGVVVNEGSVRLVGAPARFGST